jgi:hypothetical protein
MNKPDGWDKLPAQTGNSERPVGPHICIIKDAMETKSKGGNDMVVYFLDIAEGPQKGFYQRIAKPESGWPARMFRVLNNDTMPRFKGDIKAVEESNGGYIFNFDIKTLVGKKVGCNFREEEYIAKDGDLKTSVKPAYLFPIGDLEKQKVMKAKTIAPTSSSEPLPHTGSNLPF